MNILTNLARSTTTPLSRQISPLVTSSFANAASTSTSATSSSTTTTTANNNNYQLHRSYHATTTPNSPDWHGTTIVCVRKNGRVCMMGDGMVSMGSVIVKPNARKIRRIYPKTVGGKINTNTTSGTKTNTDSNNDNNGNDNDNNNNPLENEGTIVGFAGTTADAFTLLERLESKLDEYPGQLTRSCVELAKGWRTDKYLRRLEASLLVADKKTMLEITGNGDVLESHDGVLGVGSGSSFAIAAARAQMEDEGKSAEEVARKAMEIAASMCIYTNDNFMVESLKMEEEEEGKDGDKANTEN